MATLAILRCISQVEKMSSGLILKQCLSKLPSTQGYKIFTLGGIKNFSDEKKPTVVPTDLHNLMHGPISEEQRREERKKLITIETVEDIAVTSGVPEEHIKTRTVRIFQPAKNAMQSGTDNINHWRIDFDTRERWENPLMGWCSTGDPLSNVNVQFTSVEEAIAHCEKMRWKYYIQKPNAHEPKPRSYGTNFSWDKRTRVTTK
ncbi:NADH dehydrogenase [ubiquinone] iron-sulfur protein 4, mitochondrial [Chelonus insularis]|uniref:NADH dehydrogenase [ubiquinone] iron-sulfur protein 4, mitochondrial n=1 Tax=Chelonus insularis TaxID=460826 RepID=UPI001588A029|nr:NADH dehydrogenase [ubiquinone] iron-sulfur protein 4, mitochondrial [Chelonus insularis]